MGGKTRKSNLPQKFRLKKKTLKKSLENMSSTNIVLLVSMRVHLIHSLKGGAKFLRLSEADKMPLEHILFLSFNSLLFLLVINKDK